MPEAARMVVRRTTYPQVDARARGLMTASVAVVPRGLALTEAEGVARRRRARLLVARQGSRWGGVTRETLARAAALGLGPAPVAAILWLAPTVTVDAPEVAVRRAFGATDEFVVVVRGDRVVGAVFPDLARRALPASAAAALAALPEPLAGLLRTAGDLADRAGTRVAVVGGFARDLLRGAPVRRDVDLVVEGDAAALAQALARTRGGEIRVHPGFGTATVAAPGGVRVDVATARRERYARPGALPVVEAATLEEDVRRRDFTVNALAIRLDRAARGTVLDVTGGLEDLRRRRIRVLHPLSFVEDPTRVFRAVRFAGRLDGVLDGATRHLLQEATRLPAYEALSADRLHRELAAVLAEADAGSILGRLARLGVFRLLCPGWRREGTGTERLLAAVAERTRGLPLRPGTPVALVVLALTGHLDDQATRATLGRAGVAPGLATAALRARGDAPALLAGLGRAPGRGAAYRLLRAQPELLLAWALVRARGGARRVLGEHLTRWREIRPLLSGDDLMALGLPPGPELGRRLLALRAAQVDGRIRDRAAALAWARATLGGGTAASEERTLPGTRGG